MGPVVPSTRKLSFTPAEMDRLRWCCQALGTTFAEFLHDAALQACDEVQGVSAAVARERRGVPPPASPDR